MILQISRGLAAVLAVAFAAAGLGTAGLGTVGLGVVRLAQTPPSFRNILVAAAGGPGFPPCEPSVAVSGRDVGTIVAGTVLDRVMATTDGGKTWTHGNLKSPYRVDGDPAIIADSKGRFFYFHLAISGKDPWPDRIVCQSSLDSGQTWSPGEVVAYNPPTNQDKAWATTHPTKPYVYAAWTQFDKYGSHDPSCLSIIQFGMSKDAGRTWSKPVTISEIPGNCIDDSGTTEGAVPAVSAGGRIYVTWSSQGIIFLNRSNDEGKTWLRHNIAVAKQYGGWDMAIPGLDRSNGMPVLQVDNSRSSHRGDLYLTWADQRHGAADTDIFFSRSSDGGDTWTPAMRVNQDGPGKEQFLPWMSVDQTTGYIYIVYYDRRAYDDLKTDVYLAYSNDGGRTFHEQKISESPFVPSANRFFGDYTNISAHNGQIVPIWARMDDGKTSVWTAVIKQSEVVK